MLKPELKKFIASSIDSQGSASSVALSSLTEQLLKYIPSVIHIAEEPTESEAGTFVYAITDDQEYINDTINDLITSEAADVVIHDKGVTLHFNHIEVVDDLIVCYLVTHDGKYTLTLSREEGLSDLAYVRTE